MTGEPDLPSAENHPQAPSWQYAAQPPPQDHAIPLAGDDPSPQARPQSQGGTALPATRPSFNFGRLRPGDVIAGIASFLVFISLFFPWYSFAASAAQSGEQATPAQQQLVLAICGDQPTVCSSDVAPHFSVTALGGGAGGWRWLILVVAIVAVLYVLSRTLEGTARAVPYHWQALAGITAVQGLLVLIAFIANPLGILDSFGSSSWAFGSVLALIAAIAAVVGAILVMRETKKQPAFSSAAAHAAGSLDRRCFPARYRNSYPDPSTGNAGQCWIYRRYRRYQG
jgi:hypothetical protein